MACRKSSRRKKSSTPRGKAAAMGPELWRHWVCHVRRHSPWLAACITLTYALALRITESLALKAGDFDFRNHTVRVAGLKGAATVKKPMLKAARPLLTRKHGMSTIRARHCGARGEVRKKETWLFPEENHRFLFPSHRSDAKLARRCKDTVCNGETAEELQSTEEASGIPGPRLYQVAQRTSILDQCLQDESSPRPHRHGVRADSGREDGTAHTT
ncbi:unnamed protein product [Symbiodinium sp. CCMP2592]|nr:unnamed protein product [Symbiodinium sp. CCMP2592]